VPADFATPAISPYLCGMVHVRQLGFFGGIFLSVWLYMLDIAHLGKDSGYIWLAPFFIMFILVVLALRRLNATAETKPDFTTLIRTALGVIVIGVVIFNIAAYIYFKWVHTGTAEPFQTALFFSWAMLAMGMVITLAVSFVFFLLPKRKM
jgi:hypothetical protein